MEGYSMYEDGYVIDIKVSKCENDMDQTLDQYVAILSNVKPRIRDKDPVTKKDFYSSWIITTSAEDFQGGSIFSAYCSCKGGADGSCRHVVPTLFELVNFLDDRSKQSVTSGECQWKTRARETEPPILVTDLDISIESNFNKVVEKPIEDNYNPISDHIGRPNIETFIECLKRDNPEACLLDTIEPRPKPVKKQKILQFNITTPIDNAKKFFLSHADCGKCTDECLLSYQVNLEYSKEELKKIELGTRGQSENENWYKMRRGLLTASKFKEILHSRSQDITATNLLKDSGINENALPETIAYGRKNESKAREMYARNHKYQH